MDNFGAIVFASLLTCAVIASPNEFGGAGYVKGVNVCEEDIPPACSHLSGYSLQLCQLSHFDSLKEECINQLMSSESSSCSDDIRNLCHQQSDVVECLALSFDRITEKCSIFIVKHSKVMCEKDITKFCRLEDDVNLCLHEHFFELSSACSMATKDDLRFHCAVEEKTLCSNTHGKEKCLVEHFSKLSDECAREIERRPLLRTCADDIESLCSFNREFDDDGHHALGTENCLIEHFNKIQNVHCKEVLVQSPLFSCRVESNQCTGYHGGKAMECIFNSSWKEGSSCSAVSDIMHCRECSFDSAFDFGYQGECTNWKISPPMEKLFMRYVRSGSKVTFGFEKHHYLLKMILIIAISSGSVVIISILYRRWKSKADYRVLDEGRYVHA